MEKIDIELQYDSRCGLFNLPTITIGTAVIFSDSFSGLILDVRKSLSIQLIGTKDVTK